MAVATSPSVAQTAVTVCGPTPALPGTAIDSRAVLVVIVSDGETVVPSSHNRWKSRQFR
jgi:hypothetical protein